MKYLKLIIPVILVIVLIILNIVFNIWIFGFMAGLITGYLLYNLNIVFKLFKTFNYNIKEVNNFYNEKE